MAKKHKQHPLTKIFKGKVIALSAALIVSATIVGIGLNREDVSNAVSVSSGCQSALVIGHRGTSAGGIRNNTINAFQKAVAAGAEVVEFDIRRTKGDSSNPATWIVNHDATIDGKTISSTTYATLKKIRPDLATYREAIQYLATTDRKIHFEVKPADTSSGSFTSLMNVIRENGVEGRTELASFDTTNLSRARSAGFKTIYNSSNSVSTTTVKKYASAIGANKSIVSSSMVRSFQSAGVKVYVYTVNSESEFAKYASYGVDGMYTDYAGTYNSWCNKQQL